MDYVTTDSNQLPLSHDCIAVEVSHVFSSNYTTFLNAICQECEGVYFHKYENGDYIVMVFLFNDKDAAQDFHDIIGSYEPFKVKIKE